MRKPYKICKKETEYLRKLLAAHGITSKYDIYVTDTVRGRCCYKNRNITVPWWALNVAVTGEKPGYDLYYACHEIAHSIAGYRKGDQHGPRFQKAFMNLCPKEYQHYELGYKPRLAAAAGIRKNAN